MTEIHQNPELGYVESFNAAVRTGDWDPFVATLHPDAVLTFHGPPIGPFRGRAAIAAAYAADPPGDTIEPLRVEPGGIIRFAWSRGGTGTLILTWADGRPIGVTVRFD